jgi:hypothetical protein
MAYCIVKDVEDLMGTKFSHDSRPPVREVESMIATIAAELDGVAQAAGYDVPITGAQGVALLKRYTIFGAGVAAWHTMIVSEDEPARVTYWREQYDNFLARLRRGEQGIPGETIEAEEDIAFAIAPHPQRDRHWLTGETL